MSKVKMMSKVKICGLSRMADIEAVNYSMPDYIGFVFAPSRRRIDPQTAAALKAKLAPRIATVGVFVNESVATVSSLCKNGLLDVVQLHGDEDAEYIRRLKEDCGCRVIKSIGVGDELPPLVIEADYLLFDTLSAQRGGAGRAFNWNLLQGYEGPPYFLSGGLTPDRVCEALNLLAPYCVDVSSGVETNGVKDVGKIDQFIRSVREIK